MPPIAISAAQASFMQILLKATKARNVVEVGTLGGYSAIWTARGLAPDGRLITIEANPKHAEVARANLARAGFGAARVEVRVGDAHEVLSAVAREGPFDVCFIDAEKAGYGAYLDWALANVRAGGVIAAHNAFKGGDLLDPTKNDADVAAIRTVNDRFARDPRVASSIFPAGDGTVFGIVLG
jgi:predicted O-methyltransferase YrrM